MKRNYRRFTLRKNPFFFAKITKSLIFSFFFKIGLKFFLGREIPKEPLVFMIRCLGGQVSWDNTAAPGSTFNVEDTSVTHQICDRPRDSVDMKHIERFYIQPQWVSHTAQKEIF